MSKLCIGRNKTLHMASMRVSRDSLVNAQVQSQALMRQGFGTSVPFIVSVRLVSINHNIALNWTARLKYSVLASALNAALQFHSLLHTSGASLMNLTFDTDPFSLHELGEGPNSKKASDAPLLSLEIFLGNHAPYILHNFLAPPNFGIPCVCLPMNSRKPWFLLMNTTVSSGSS